MAFMLVTLAHDVLRVSGFGLRSKIDFFVQHLRASVVFTSFRGTAFVGNSLFIGWLCHAVDFEVRRF